jgi:hypothetical protein
MDKVQKYNSFNTNTPSSESYRNYLGVNIYGVHDVRQMDAHTAVLLVPEPSLVEMKIPVGKLKS